MSFFEHFPEPEARRQQQEILAQLDQVFKSHNVIVIQAPVATGKTAIGATIAAWAAANNQTANFLLPTNILLEQLSDEYQDFATLHRKSYYICENGVSCDVMHTKKARSCDLCLYAKAKTDCGRAPMRAMNYYTYLAHRFYADILVIDEAHTLVDMLINKEDVKLWGHIHKFPPNMRTVADVVAWLDREIKKTGRKLYQDVKYMLSRISATSAVEYSREVYRGTEQNVLQIKGTSARTVPPWMWPARKVKKIVLMSATINETDIRELGLDRRNVAYIRTDSPIPPSNRPFTYNRVANLASRHLPYALPLVGSRLLQKLDECPDSGLVHIPYKAAEQLRGVINHPRLIWHTRDDKKEQLERFKNTPGSVLVASGLYEGVDLPYNLARWQVIVKVPYLYLGDERIRKKSDTDPSWYAWEAIKRILQATGRITRHPDDYGETEIWDSNFERLFRQNRELFPSYFLPSLRGIR